MLVEEGEAVLGSWYLVLEQTRPRKGLPCIWERRRPAGLRTGVSVTPPKTPGPRRHQLLSTTYYLPLSVPVADPASITPQPRPLLPCPIPRCSLILNNRISMRVASDAASRKPARFIDESSGRSHARAVNGRRPMVRFVGFLPGAPGAAKGRRSFSLPAPADRKQHGKRT